MCFNASRSILSRTLLLCLCPQAHSLRLRVWLVCYLGRWHLSLSVRWFSEWLKQMPCCGAKDPGKCDGSLESPRGETSGCSCGSLQVGRNYATLARGWKPVGSLKHATGATEPRPLHQMCPFHWVDGKRWHACLDSAISTPYTIYGHQGRTSWLMAKSSSILTGDPRFQESDDMLSVGKEMRYPPPQLGL